MATHGLSEAERQWKPVRMRVTVLQSVVLHGLQLCKRKQKACVFTVHNACGLGECIYKWRDHCSHVWGPIQDGRGAKKYFRRCRLCKHLTYKVMELSMKPKKAQSNLGPLFGG